MRTGLGRTHCTFWANSGVLRVVSLGRGCTRLCGGTVCPSEQVGRLRADVGFRGKTVTLSPLKPILRRNVVCNLGGVRQRLLCLRGFGKWLPRDTGGFRLASDVTSPIRTELGTSHPNCRRPRGISRERREVGNRRTRVNGFLYTIAGQVPWERAMCTTAYLPDSGQGDAASCWWRLGEMVLCVSPASRCTFSTVPS